MRSRTSNFCLLFTLINQIYFFIIYNKNLKIYNDNNIIIIEGLSAFDINFIDTYNISVIENSTVVETLSLQMFLSE